MDRDFSEVIKKLEQLGTETEQVLVQASKAEAETAEALVDLFKPVLRYIAEFIPTNYYHPGGQFSGYSEDVYCTKGIHITGDWTKKIWGSDDTRGGYEGVEYWLLTTGKVLRIRWDGSWSNWQGESTARNAKCRVVEPGTAVEVYEELDIEELSEALIAACKEAVAKNENKLRTLQSRMDKLEKVKAIVGM